MTKRFSAAAAILLFLGGMAEPASAQVSPFGRESMDIDREELNLMYQAIYESLEQYKVGATEKWKSPERDVAGRASLSKVFTQKGLRCGEVEHVFTAGGGRRYLLPFCKTKEGQWKLAF